ncbi:MAG: hypothetical protein EA350_10180 [Gemmatimonadales bacterium]|nr:MAG: hypothetical protein EA350_10180 [Gemmatimonadales bacterium]
MLRSRHVRRPTRANPSNKDHTMNAGRRRRTRNLLAFLPGLALVAVGCDASPAAPVDAELSAHDHHAAHAAAALRGGPPSRATPVRAHGDLLKAVRQQTARFNATKQAERFGYEIDPHCVAHPDLGAMGHHAVNMDLVDPVFDPMQPEALLYIPNEDGRLKLVGVEYIVINVGQAWPEFDGTRFDFEGVPPLMAAGVPHWSLHVWAHADNPSGTFFPFNPALSCS